MEYFKRVTLLVLRPDCYDEYFANFNITNASCFKSTLSSCLGYGIILGSSLVKVPQILKLYGNKNGEGVSVSSATLDLAAIDIHLSYSFLKGFPFTGWGDKAFLAVQNVIIAAQVLHYNGETNKAIAFVVGYAAITSMLISGVVPVKLLWILQGVNIPLSLVGKLVQAYTNHKNGHTGQLSAVTAFLLLAGTLSRIFTSIQETGDLMTILNYIGASLGNSIIVMQLICYWNIKVDKKKTK